MLLHKFLSYFCPGLWGRSSKSCVHFFANTSHFFLESFWSFPGPWASPGCSSVEFVGIEAVHGQGHHFTVTADTDSCISTTMLNPFQVLSVENQMHSNCCLISFFLLALYCMKDLPVHFSSPVTPFSKAAAPFSRAHDSVTFNVFLL